MTLGGVERKGHPVEPWQLAGAGPVQRGELRGRRIDAFALGLALLALNVLDVTVTHFGIAWLGAVELNPLVAPLVATPWVLVLKVGIPVCVLLLTPRVRSPYAVIGLRLAVGIYLVVVLVGMGQMAYALA